MILDYWKSASTMMNIQACSSTIWRSFPEMSKWAMFLWARGMSIYEDKWSITTPKLLES